MSASKKVRTAKKRGRTPQPAALDRRPYGMCVYPTKAERRALERAAKREAMPLAVYVREAALEKARKA